MDDRVAVGQKPMPADRPTDAVQYMIRVLQHTAFGEIYITRTSALHDVDQVQDDYN